MASKVHTVDLNAVEFIEGISDLDSAEQVATYVAVVFAIYARNGPVANDAEWINRTAKIARTRPTRAVAACRRALDQLLAKGKLKLTDDGRLTNSRCERALETARRRMGGLRQFVDQHLTSNRPATDQQPTSNRPPTDQQPTSNETPVSAKINGLDPSHGATTTTTTTSTTKNTPPHTSSDAARDPSATGGGGGGGGGGGAASPGHDPDAFGRWRVPYELEALVQKQRPDITSDVMRERTRDWRDYARDHGIPRDFAKSWLGWQLKTPRRPRSRSM